MDYKGYSAHVDTTAKQDDAGKWNVIVIYSQSRSSDLLEWEKESVKFMSSDEDFVKAMTDTQMTLASYLKAVQGSLFAKELPDDKTDGNKDTESK